MTGVDADRCASGERVEEAAHGDGEGDGIVVVDDVASVESGEAGIGAAVGHLLELIGNGDAAFAATDEKSRTGGGEEIGPVIAAELLLRTNKLAGLEGEAPALGRVAKGVRDVLRKTRADFRSEGFAGWVDAGPGQDEADVVGDRGSDVFDDESGDLFGVERGELVGIDAAEGTAKEDGVLEAQMGEERFDIGDVVGAGVGGSVAGVAVTALIESNDAPIGGERFGEGSEGRGFHQVAVQGDKDGAAGAGIQIGEGEAVLMEAVAGEAHRGFDGTSDAAQAEQKVDEQGRG